MNNEKFSENLAESATVLVKPIYTHPIVSELLMNGIDTNHREFLFEFYNQSPYFVDSWKQSYEIAAKRNDITAEERLVFENLAQKLSSIYDEMILLFNETIGTFNKNKPSKPANTDMLILNQEVIKEASVGTIPELLVTCIGQIIIADLITNYIKSHSDYKPNKFLDAVFGGFRCDEFVDSLMVLLDKRNVDESERTHLTSLFNRILSVTINTIQTIINDSV